MDPETDKPQDAKRIGKYDVIEVLGRGGMGVVYRALDKRLGREVAIKTLTEGVAGDAEMLARFYEEGRKTARLKHPHIVTVYDLGEDNGVPYIVMERVEGHPLDVLIRNESQLTTMDRLRIVEEVCSALGYAHRNNVIHRDVKPANIFVQPDGKAKLLDFGIARLERRSQDQSLTRAGLIIGTLPYMAPERMTDRAVDGRSDIFSLGVVLYQLIGGQLPFSGEDCVLMQKIASEQHAPLASLWANCPAGLQAIVDKALAKSADQRYQTAEEMADDLTAVIEELRQERIVELLPEARRLIEAQDLGRARLLLQEVLKVQSKHTEARELLSEIQRMLAQKQRDDRLEQILQHGEEALARRNFDEALSAVKEGLQLDAAHAGLLNLSQNVRDEKRKREQVEEFVRQVDTARRKGDFKAAVLSAQEALKIDGNNSKIVLLCNSLIAEAEQAERKLRAGELLEQARRQLQSRRFEIALETLAKVEELDPAEPEVPLLRVDAYAGVEQNRRKEQIAKLEEEISLASTLEQLQACAEQIREVMAAMPADPTLLRLSTQAHRHLKELQDIRLVEDTIQACRNLRPREALELVRQGRLKLPSDDRLLRLETSMLQRAQQQAVEGRRAEYFSKARKCLDESRFADAAQTLEACQTEGLADDEVLALLEFIRAEQAEQDTQALRQSAIVKAQCLLNEGCFEEAIRFLDDSLLRSDDVTLRLLMEQAVSARAALQQEVEDALAAAEKLVQARKTDEALQLLRTLPPQVLNSAQVRLAIALMENEANAVLFRMTGRAYALLASDLVAADAIMRRVAAASSDASGIGPLTAAFRARQEAIADRLLTESAKEAEDLIRTHQRLEADRVMQRAELVVPLASSKARSTWQVYTTYLNKKSMLRRTPA